MMTNSCGNMIRIKVAEYKVAEYREKLDHFGRIPYRYKGKKLFMQCEQVSGKASGKPILADEDLSADSSDIVGLSPSICSSFAIWPNKSEKLPANDLLDVCPDEVLRPQLVFVAFNWSAKVGDFYANGNTPKTFFDSISRWSNFHNLQQTHKNTKASRLEVAFLNKNPLRGGYMVDFIKGLVDSDGNKAFSFLAKEEKEVPELGYAPFRVFLKILKQELAALDKCFAIPDSAPKYLIFFGPTIYNRLQILSRRFCKGKPLEKVFKNRIILRTGAFYSGVFGLSRKENIQQLREIYRPSAAGPHNVADLSVKLKKR